MKPKDLTESFYDKIMDILFSYIKDYIDWKFINDIIPGKVWQYSKRKKCQLLLTIADTRSPYTAKYRSDVMPIQAMQSALYFIDNFRPTRSLMYMKALRKSYMVDVFDMYAFSYDTVLRQANFSHDKALAMVKSSEADVLIKTANNLKNECVPYRADEEDDDDEIYETYIERNERILAECDDLTEITSLFSLNCKRVSSNIIFTLFDIQSLYNIAFDSAFGRIHSSETVDGFEMAKRQKIIGELISTIMEVIHETIDCSYEVETQYDKESQCSLKIHKIFIPEDDHTKCEVQVTVYDPLIITEAS